MANVFLAAVLLSGILAVSGCAGLVPGLEALGSRRWGLPILRRRPRPTPMIPGKAGAMPSRFNPIISPSPTLIPATPESTPTSRPSRFPKQPRGTLRRRQVVG